MTVRSSAQDVSSLETFSHCRGGAGASGQSPAQLHHPLLRVDGHEDVRLLSAGQGGDQSRDGEEEIEKLNDAV